MTKQSTKDLTKVLRHGDISLHKVDSIPENAKLVSGGRDFKGLDFILQYGESTNHFHRLNGGKTMVEATADDPEIQAMFVTGKFKIYETKEGARYVKVDAPTPLSHEEHKTIIVPTGIYKQEQESEEDPASEAVAEQRVRSVID